MRVNLSGNYMHVKDNEDGSYVASGTHRKIGRADIMLSVNGQDCRQHCYHTEGVYNYKVTSSSEIIDDDGHRRI